ncbi:MAG: flavin-containing monooxygenase [Gemmatimonadales bacterium]
MTRSADNSSVSQSVATVVGGGPAGVAATKELVRRRVDVVCFEASDDLAPHWRLSAPGTSSPVYESLRLNNSRGRMRFRESAMPTSTGTYPSYIQFRQYLREIVRRSKLEESFRYSMRVDKISQIQGRWILEVGNGGRHVTDHLVVATGLNWKAIMPYLLDQFDGDRIHSSAYRSPDRFAGRRVMVLGCGNSGAEIASELAFTARKTIVAVPKGFHIVPRRVLGVPSDRLDGPLLARLPYRLRDGMHTLAVLPTRIRAARAGIPKPRLTFLRGPWVISSEILRNLENGSVVRMPWPVRFDGGRAIFEGGQELEIDAVVAATGYEPGFPEMPVEPAITRHANECYHKMIDPRLPNVYFIGFVLPLGALLPTVEIQSEWTAAVVSGDVAVPAVGDMEESVKQECTEDRRRFAGRNGATITVDPYPYKRRLRREINGI